MNKHKLYYANASKEKTPFVMVPKSEDVFVDFKEEYRNIILPLMEMDLQAIHPDYPGKAYFLYHECVYIDWVISELNEDFKIESMRFMTREGDLLGLDDEKINELQDGYEETLDMIHQYAGPYITIKGKQITDKEFKEFSEYKEYSEYIQSEYMKMINEGRMDDSFFGPYPQIIQNVFTVPVLKGSDQPFLFVGQLSTAEKKFGYLIDTEYYLFYHPEKRILAQFMQST